MAHYALLDENNIVTQVITGIDESKDPLIGERLYSQLFKQVCKRTSYNTYGNKHYKFGIPFRLNFAGIGYVYREDLDGFIPPQPYESWTLNTSTGLWVPPTLMPQDGGPYFWDEDSQSWTVLDMDS